MSTEHFRLLFVENAPPEKWLALGKYCLQQSGLAPEVTELVKAQGPLWHRQVRPAEVEGTAPDPFSDPVIEVAWQALHRAGPVLWALLTTPPAQRRANVWLSLPAVLNRVSDVVRLLCGGFPWVSRIPRWLQGLPERLFDVFGQAALQPFYGHTGVFTPALAPLLPAVRAHAEVALTPVVTEAALTPVSREGTAIQQHLLGHPTPEAEQLARETAAEERWLQRWSAVVRTELADAHATGTVGALVQETGPETAQVVEVYRVPSVRACLACQALYLEPDGAPKLYPLGELIANGTNQGRRQAEWRAVVGSTHPSCICAPPQRYLPLMEELFDRMRAAHVAAEKHEEARI